MDVLLKCFLGDMLIQVIGFIFAFILSTEKFFDFVGSLTYILLASYSFKVSPISGSRQQLLTALVILWAMRLGIFLLSRVLMTGGDKRFDKIKPNPLRYFIYWMVQGIWIFLTILPVMITNRKILNNRLGNRDYLGLAIWIIGFLFEVVADYQKFVFKLNPEKSKTFISEGLWSISRHPNYFGEITLWIGVFIIASSSLQGLEWLSVISPIFVYYLLTSISGVPILEKSGLKRYGHLDEYKAYINTVPVLVPFIGKP